MAVNETILIDFTDILNNNPSDAYVAVYVNSSNNVGNGRNLSKRYIKKSLLTSLLLQVNGVNNTLQSVLNLIAGSNITLTPNGSGGVTIDATGGSGGTYTADNGLTESPANNFQWGGTLIQNTVIDSGTFFTLFTGNRASPNPIVAIQNTGTGSGLSISTNYTTLRLTSNYSSLNTVEDNLQLIRTAPGLVASGIGQAIQFRNQSSSGSFITANKIISEITDVTPATFTSKMRLVASLNALDVDVLTLFGNGQLQANNYGVGTFVSAAVYILGVDINGNVVETTVSGTGTVTSVAATVPTPTNPAFSVNVPNPTTTPSVDITANGIVSQYIRGDGSLANFPTSIGGGSSLSYYLNGSVSQGTLGGVAFRQMSSTPVIGAGTNFSISADGYIQSFITDASVPNQLLIPAGNWNFEMYFQSSSSGGSPSFYIELYKLSGGVLSLIASSVANPEFITNGTAVDLYTTALAVPSTVLLAADRLAIRVYVTHSGRTITLHTEDSNLCQVITTFSTGLTALNGLTAQVQTFVNDTNVTIVSASTTHTITWAGILSIARGGTGLSALGTALQQIRVNAGGTALEYFTPTAVPSSFITYRRLVASATLDATDLTNVNTGAPYVIEMNVGGANNLTIPLNATIAFTIGSQITVSQYGAGQTTIVATGGVTLRSAGSFLKLAAQYSMCTLMKVGTDEWYVVGQLAP
jgi:hypothetical protein